MLLTYSNEYIYVYIYLLNLPICPFIHKFIYLFDVIYLFYQCLILFIYLIIYYYTFFFFFFFFIYLFYFLFFIIISLGCKT